MKIGVMFGNPETTTGGNALKFYASVRLDIRKGNAIKEQEEVLGNETKVKVVKNKVATPFKVCELTFNTNEEKKLYGFDNVAEVIDIAIDKDLIKKTCQSSKK